MECLQVDEQKYLEKFLHSNGLAMAVNDSDDDDCDDDVRREDAYRKIIIDDVMF